MLDLEKTAVDSVILTHWHPDHVGGVKDLLELNPSAAVFKHSPSAGQRAIADGQCFETAGATLRALHCPGHTADHMALVLEQEDAMFTGDNVLGHGTAVFEDLTAYMASLELMAGRFGGRAYPGHGAVVEDGKAKVRDYIKHRREREEQVIAVLGSDKEKAWWTAMEIVKVIYKDYPENLYEPAKGGVLQILGKLEKEGKVRKNNSNETWSLCDRAVL